MVGFESKPGHLGSLLQVGNVGLEVGAAPRPRVAGIGRQQEHRCDSINIELRLLNACPVRGSLANVLYVKAH